MLQWQTNKTLRVGIEPTTLRLEVSRAIQLRQWSCMHSVGFEPTPPKRLELESSALDHSATNAIYVSERRGPAGI